MEPKKVSTGWLIFVVLPVIVLLIYLLAYLRLGASSNGVNVDTGHAFVVRMYAHRWEATFFRPAAFIDSLITHRDVRSEQEFQQVLVRLPNGQTQMTLQQISN